MLSSTPSTKSTTEPPTPEPILPASWDAKAAADKVLKGLFRITPSIAKGAHDAEFVCVGDHAFIVEHDNDVAPGHGEGEHQYCILSIVSLSRREVVATLPLAHSEQTIGNVTLPRGACFVPRVIQKDADTLRCFFATQPRSSEAQMWYRDFRISKSAFDDSVHKVMLKTSTGIVEMRPKAFYDDAVLQGFAKEAKLFGLYIVDSFKVFDGRTYVTINNFEAKQNALAILHDDFVTFEILGHYNEPQSQQMSESAVNRLPDGRWLAICRNDAGNYLFVESQNGKDWSEGKELPHVQCGGNSKPIFDRFGDVYYLGWQSSTIVSGCYRSVFNLDVSRDGAHWERKYRFESEFSFQYPTLHEHEGKIWLSVTQSDHLGSTDRIMFGLLENLYRQ